ncbi:unnamed protein product [Linum tenue]|uniref:Uncharacterized protein n=1 Tax=Linum tenue TaxID=586396 RepID=A0AAV0HUQ2_9ROSI|nr:unnamed protein product [Linum tenue]
MVVSTEEAPSLCWDATVPECSASLVERFISKRIPLIKQREMQSWSVTSTCFTIDRLMIVVITIVMFGFLFLHVIILMLNFSVFNRSLVLKIGGYVFVCNISCQCEKVLWGF